MAEVLGVVAGAVGISGFAGQILTGAIKLKNLYSLMKSADQELLTLADDLCNFAAILEQAEAQNTGSYTPIPPHLAQCYQSCRVLVARIQPVVRELELRIEERGKFGRARFILKRDRLKELRDALTRASQPLFVGIASFSSATTVANYKALLELRSEIMNEFQGLRSRDRQNIAKDLRSKEIWKEKEDPEHITSSLILRRRNSRRREEAITTRCVISLAWLKTSWVIETRKAYQGWSFSFRIRNTIPLDSPVFDYAWDGDVEGLRVLFETKFASPHDMDIDGWTPLHYAARNDQPSTVRFLIENGADVNASDRDNESCFEAFWKRKNNGHRRGPEVSESLRLLLEEHDGFYSRDNDFYNTLEGWSEYQRYSDLNFVQKKVYPSYEDIPISARAQIPWFADDLNYTIEFFWLTIGQKQLDNVPYEVSEEVWWTVVTNLAYVKYRHPAMLQPWSSVLAQLRAASCGSIGKIDFSMLFQNFTLNGPLPPSSDKISNHLEHLWQDWIEELTIAGVDIRKDGNQILRSFSRHKHFNYIQAGPNRMIRVRVINAICTASMEDCKIWISWPLDEWAGDFWRWVENPEILMPGSWVDEADQDDWRIYYYCPRGEVAWDSWCDASAENSKEFDQDGLNVMKIFKDCFS